MFDLTCKLCRYFSMNIFDLDENENGFIFDGAFLYMPYTLTVCTFYKLFLYTYYSTAFTYIYESLLIQWRCFYSDKNRHG